MTSYSYALALQEEAEAFARAVAPSTVYHVEDGKSTEIVSY